MSSFETLTLHRLLLAVILTLLLLLGYNILAVFIIPMAWAGILAYVTWPIYSRLLLRLKQRHNLAALMMTCSLILLLVVPLLFAVVMLQSEVVNVYHVVLDTLKQHKLVLPPFMQSLQPNYKNC